MDVASPHFVLQELGAGIWAAIPGRGSGLGCNAGIVDLGDRTLVFDTGMTLVAARDLRAAAEALTGRPVLYAVNSHVHPDHMQGNLIFAETAAIIASEVTRAAIAADGLRWLEQMRGELGDAVRGVEQLLAEAREGAERRGLEERVARARAVLAGYPAPADLWVPDMAFERALTFYGTAGAARLITFGGGHSECDAVLHLPEAGVLFTGDLVTDGNQILCFGSPEAWLGILDRLEELGAAWIVPGHGPVMPAGEAIAYARRYITGLLETVNAATAAGAGEELAEQLPVPEGCGEYWFRENIRFLMRRKDAIHVLS